MENQLDAEPLSILIVAKTDQHRSSINSAIVQEGIQQIAETDSAEDALELLRYGNFDVLLLDIQDSEADAHLLLKRLRADLDIAHISTVVLWSGEDHDVLVEFISLGIDDHLRWPLDTRLISARLQACIEKKHLRQAQARHLDLIKTEKRRADDLLNVMLPAAAASELKATGKVLPRAYDDVGLLFCDIADFTSYCSNRSPVEVVEDLQSVIAAFEDVCGRHKMEKIKTIGDAIMVTAGLLELDFDPLLSAVKCGLEMIEEVARVKPTWQVRVGVHAGPVVAGIVGAQKYQFDVWGETVNTAARMATHGNLNTVTLTLDAWLRVEDYCRGRRVQTMDIKGIGPVDIVEVYGLR